jgi:hypothetical protein
VHRQTNVAGAAVLAGLIAGGGVYAAGHRVSDPGIAASADARAILMDIHPTAFQRARLLRWHPVAVPKHVHIKVHAAAAAAPAPAPAVAVAAPVVAPSAPTTHTSPAASGDDGSESGGGDD